MTLRDDLLRAALDTPGLTDAGHLIELADLLELVRDVSGDLLEVGVFCGRSLLVVAAAAQDFGCGAHGVDPFPASAAEVAALYPHGVERAAEEGVARALRLQQDPYALTAEALQKAGLQAHLTRGTVRDWQRENELTVLRGAFVDGDHSYEGALLDLRTVCSHLVPGGLVVVDDYEFPGVERAVAQMSRETELIEVHRRQLLALRAPGWKP